MATILYDVIPDFSGKYVSLDLEMYRQDPNKLHIPHGDFAGLAVVTDYESVWITEPRLLQDLFQELQKAKGWVVQNATYDLRQLRKFVRIEPFFELYDTMLIEQDLWGGYYSEFNLKAMARRYFNIVVEKDKYESIADKTIDIHELAKYAINDAKLALDIFKVQMELLEANPKVMRVYKTIDMPAIWMVLDIDYQKIDVQAWLDFVSVLQVKAESIESEIGLNVKSHPQVTKRLSELFGGTFKSANDEVLQKYRQNPVVEKIIQAREYRTAMEYFGKGWLDKNLLPGDVVYSDWKICGAETGRMSSRSPNLQNIPARKMPKYRDFFIPKYQKLLIADVSQQEPRILAYLSGDKTLINAFRSGEDVHLAVTREIFHDPNIQKDDERRKIGKAINLGTSYGLTPQGLSDRLGIPQEEAEKFIETYFRKFPDVKRYIDSQRTSAFKNEKVFTPFGRMIHINIHGNWENTAINAPIQGGGADMTKLWVVKFWQVCREYGFRFPVTMIVHDEVVMDVDEQEIGVYRTFLDYSFKETIKTLFPDSPVPFEYEYAIGERWSAKK